jgi:uncharacterized protein YcbX
VSGIVVSRLSVTAIKGTRVRDVAQLELDVTGARGNRRFYLIDERGRMHNGKQLGRLQAVRVDLSAETGSLELRFPDRPPVRGSVSLGEAVATRFFSRPREDRLVDGPWAQALSDFVGQPLRLVATETAVDRGRRGAASLISRASLARLAEEAGEDDVDARRFRMLIEVDGLHAHDEDRWVGSDVRVGGSVIRWHGHVGRCLVTGRDPETGEPTLPTLDLLGAYRGELDDTTEPLPFGIYGEVIEPGRVCVGDPVAPLAQ